MDDLAIPELHFDDEQDALLADDPLPAALSQYTIDELAAMEIDDSDDPLYPIRIMVAEHLARQFVNQHCPNWMTFLIEAFIDCIDRAKPVRAGMLPGDGATKSRDIAYEHLAVGESEALWSTRQAAADPVMAGISPVAFIAGELAPRLRTPVRHTAEKPAPALVCTAKRDDGLSGQNAQITQLFVPRSFAWAEGALRVHTLTRHAFATSLHELRAEMQNMVEAAPSWNVSRLIADDLDRMVKTTAGRRGPSVADKHSTAIGTRALRNLVGSNSLLAMRLIELEYVYRHYEVLR